MTITDTVESPIDTSHFERGVSEDAQRLGEMVREIVQLPDASAMSSFRGEVLQALWAAYSTSAIRNWDGEDAAAVEYSTFEYATQFLGLLPSRIPEPEVFAEPDGELAFEWDFGPRRVVSVSVGRDGTLTFASLVGAKKMSGVDYIGTRLPAPIRVALEAVVAGY